ncbi:class I SAM-dependent methyltransferase [Hoeflea sp. TYP-13]|uniref:class I SAM-dependent methyltransferase n=1 Tax=Hoeflea sp. TYP-13 TaxID=3230023 RepID=UPI0034C688F6
MTGRQYRNASNLAARGRLHSKYARVNWFEWVARRMELPDNSRVLDAGCGAARFWCTPTNVRRKIDLTLTDQSAGMIEAAEKNIAALKSPIEFHRQVADIRQLPFADRTFDNVMAMHMLYHLPNPDDGLSEIARVLKPGGQVFITTNGMSHMRELHALASEAYGGPSVDPGARAFGIDRAEECLKEHFSNVSVSRCDDFLDCTSPDDVRDYLLSMPPGDGLDQGQRIRLEQMIAREFERGGGIFSIRKEAALFKAVKTP